MASTTFTPVCPVWASPYPIEGMVGVSRPSLHPNSFTSSLRTETWYEPKYEYLGQPFESQIENFQGFKQLQSNWCWIAVAKTIYYWLTGATLSQARLAGIPDPQTERPDIYSDKSGFHHSTSRYDCSKGESLGKYYFDTYCNHTGETWLALDYLNAGLPLSWYSTEGRNLAANRIRIYKMIQASLKRRVPVALSIKWPNGNGHAVIAYGARFAMGTNGSLDVIFKIFNPYDGKSSYMQNGRFTSSTGAIANWTGEAYFANVHLSRRASVDKSACKFLTEESRRQFCPTIKERIIDALATSALNLPY